MLTVVLISVALVIFFAGNATRVVKTLRMPAHLRWELYPIPKGPRERQRYGGCYFAQSHWWTKPRAAGHTGELAFIAKEVLLLQSVWENFRGLWLWSWLLHWGLYLYLLATLCATAGAFLPAHAGAGILLHAAVIYGYRLSYPLGLAGALGLLVMRGWHPRLRAFTTRSSIFDLALLGSLFATGMMLSTTAPAGLRRMSRRLPPHA